MSQRLLIAVIGSASNSLCDVQKRLAMAVGQQVIDSGCRLITGGMGGVMMAASLGARQSVRYQSGDVIGLLPSYSKAEANSYLDIVLPTGLGVARNAVLMSAGDAVIALDGGSGTLSEIALAWQMQKPIACIGNQGWHQRLSSLALDQRRDDALCVLNDTAALADFLAQLQVTELSSFQGIQLSGSGRVDAANKEVVNKELADKNEATMSAANNTGEQEILKQYLARTFRDMTQNRDFTLLGQGSEGTVFACGKRIFKVFHRSDFMMLLFSHLSQLSELRSNDTADEYAPVPPFTVHKGDYLVVHYPAFTSVAYPGGEQALMVNFLQGMHRAGLCLSNVKADNFRVLPNGQLVFIDIGRDLMPYSDTLFISMCQRAFLTVYFSQHKDFKVMCRYTNDHDDFAAVAQLDGVSQTAAELKQQFRDFYREVLNDKA